MILHFLLWSTTVGFTSFFDFIAKKRLGSKAPGYHSLRVSKFIALIISSVTAIVSLYLLNNQMVDANLANFLSIPYFAATSYFIVSFFRQIKAESANK